MIKMITLFLICAGLLSLTTDAVQGKSVGTSEILQGLIVHNVVKTWEEAKTQCQNEGAILASPTTTELLNGIKSLIGVGNTTYFIGIKSTSGSGSFKSVDGVPVDNLTSAVTDMIQQLDAHDGECLSMDQNSIRVVSCCVRLPFICYKAQIEQHLTTEITTTEKSTTAIPTTKKVLEYWKICDTHDKEYKYYDETGSCYKVHRDNKTWEDAADQCWDEGGYLVVIDNDDEAEIIKQMNLRDYPFTHIGIKDFTGQGHWQSVTGKRMDEIYNNWFWFGKPVLKNKRCGAIRPSGKLDNFDCYTESEYICEV